MIKIKSNQKEEMAQMAAAEGQSGFSLTMITMIPHFLESKRIASARLSR
jgi:hypothetical protein